jgi:hypothetical protein
MAFDLLIPKISRVIPLPRASPGKFVKDGIYRTTITVWKVQTNGSQSLAHKKPARTHV